jgi:broad specificity phosphatase PhoE
MEQIHEIENHDRKKGKYSYVSGLMIVNFGDPKTRHFMLDISDYHNDHTKHILLDINKDIGKQNKLENNIVYNEDLSNILYKIPTNINQININQNNQNNQYNQYNKIVFFIRHSQGEHNFHENYDLHNPSLTEHGKSQTIELNKKLIKLNTYFKTISSGFEVVLTSPLRRTLETGMIAFSNELDKIKKIIVPELNEFVSFQCDRGNLKNTMVNKFPDFEYPLDYDEKCNKIWKKQEQYEDLGKRCDELHDYLAARPEKIIACVSHRNLITYYLKHKRGYKLYNNAGETIDGIDGRDIFFLLDNAEYVAIRI